MSNLITHYRFTVDQYEKLIDVGILKPDSRVELIRGVVLDQPAISEQHAACVSIISRLLCKHTEDSLIVSIHNPIVLTDSEPEPDLALLRFKPDSYTSGKPRAQDVLLVIEVSDSTLEIDREIKAPLYAEANIPEYWIINLVNRCLEVYRQPTAQGYESSKTLTSGEHIEIAGFPGRSVAVSELI